MLPFEDRYTRQRQLCEVGLGGQVKLENSRVNLGTEPYEYVAAEYLTRAGVQVVHTPCVGRGDQSIASLRTVFEFAGPATVASGALIALDHIRSVLDVSGPALTFSRVSNDDSR